MPVRRLSGVVIAFLVFVLRAAAASACSCVTLADSCPKVAEADAIFEATVEAIETLPLPRPGPLAFRERLVHLRDVRAVRGEPRDEVTTGVGGGDCGYEFHLGVRYLIVGYRNPKSDRLETSICSMTAPLAQARGLLDYLQGLSAPPQGGRVWGTVMKARSWTDTSSGADAPVAGARMEIAGPVERTAITDAGGQYSFAALPPGDYTIHANLQDQPALALADDAPPTHVSLEGANDCEVANFWPLFISEISGAVLDAAGRPMAGVFVELAPADRSRSGQAPGMGTDTDEQGRYGFSGMPGGRYVAGVAMGLGPSGLAPYAVTYAHTQRGEVEVDLADGATATLQPMVLTPLSPTQVAGTVRWSDGTPAAGATVRQRATGERGPEAWLSSAMTSTDGSFVTQLWLGARYQLEIAHDAGEVQYIDVVAGPQPLIITLRPQ